MHSSLPIYNIRPNNINFRGNTSKQDSNKTSRNANEIDDKLKSAYAAVRQYVSLTEYGKTDEAKTVLSDAINECGGDKVKNASLCIGSSLSVQGKSQISRMLTRDVLKYTGVIPMSDLPEKFVPIKENIDKAKAKLQEMGLSPDSETDNPEAKEIQNELKENIAKVKEGIKALQDELKLAGPGVDHYDQIIMDKIQYKIKALREIVPVDRTNIDEVLQATPEEIFTPVTADNIKGNGITFKPVIPTDPEKLKDVTYEAVPLFTKARTVEEMIKIAKRDGVKIELVRDAQGNYYPGVKNIWSEGGYFKLDRDSFVIKYGEVPADDEYVDKEWAEQNKYKNEKGEYVVKNCAIVASDKKTVADIMPHSYVKADGSPITDDEKCMWSGFAVHKDPKGIINAVAFNKPQKLKTLEGEIETDVTMGDVEGNVYNKYRDLEKQILNNKIMANPDDPNSQKFIDLVKAGNKDAALDLLREATIEEGEI